MVRFGNKVEVMQLEDELAPLGEKPSKVAPAPTGDVPKGGSKTAPSMGGRSVMPAGSKPGNGSTGMGTQFTSLHWRDPRAFRSEEARRREINRMASNAGNLNNKLFLSHCWRKTARGDEDEDLQMKKRQMIAHLSTPQKDGGPGLVYWSDFLDLQAEGPVPWRREIEDAVRDSSKVVCFVDEGWLTSYNCLQELAFAILEGKPIVLLVLDQEAWELLTVPSGTKKAWAQEKWGPALSQYDGHEITPGEHFSKGKVESLFSYLAGINLCACRELEEANLGGMPGLMDNMQKYVMKDLIYFKQHAELKDMARKWAAGDKRSSLLLHRHEAQKWDLWVEAAEQVGASPPPTKLQKELVRQSMTQAAKLKIRLQVAAGLLLVLILMGAVASGVMASVAVQQQKEAAEQTKLAEEKEAEAQMEKVRADMQAAEAELARQVAVEKEQEAIRDKNLAQLANAASTSALIVSVLGNRVGEPVVRANELRLYIKAADLLRDGNREHMELQLINKLQQRLASRTWAAQEPLYGHYDDVICAAWSPVDSRLLASGSHDGRVIVRNVATGEVWTLEGHSSSVQSVEWSPVEANLLASGSHDTTIRIWDLNAPGAQYLRHDFSGHSGTVTALAWSQANPGKLASGSTDTAVYVWNISNGLYRELIGHTGAITCLAWFPLGENQLASGSEDRSVRLWNLVTNDKPKVFSLFNGSVTALAYSTVDGGRKLAAASVDRTIRVWRPAASGNVSVTVLANGHGAQITSVMWDPLRSANRLASVCAGGAVASWDLSKVDSPLQDVIPSVLTSITSPTQLLGSGFLFGSVGWSNMNGSVINKVRLMQTMGGGEEVRVWSLIPGVTKQLNPQTAAAESVTAVDWSAAACEGNTLAFAASDYSVQTWDFATGVGRVMTGHSNHVSAVEWSPFDCTLLASSSHDSTVRVWDTVTGQSTVLSGEEGTTMTAVAWSREDASTLAVTSWDGNLGLVQLWNLSAPADTAPTRFGILNNRPTTMKWSRFAGDSAGRLAVGEGTQISIFDVYGSNPRVVLTQGHALEVLCLAWSPTRPNVLVSGGYDNRVVLWDLEGGGMKSSTFMGHQGAVATVVWSADGLKFATGSPAEANVRVWDFSSPDLVQVLAVNARQTGVSALAWSEEEGLLVSGSPDDALIRVWTHTRRDSQAWGAALQLMLDGDPTIRLSDLTDFDLPRDMLEDLEEFALN
uniref:TIR domain-containing protein n=1 Tax=Tetraselmis chuii TaxID=63592 RepID=A0A7S1SMQ4_9CHLO